MGMIVPQPRKTWSACHGQVVLILAILYYLVQIVCAAIALGSVSGIERNSGNFKIVENILVPVLIAVTVWLFMATFTGCGLDGCRHKGTQARQERKYYKDLLICSIMMIVHFIFERVLVGLPPSTGDVELIFLGHLRVWVELVLALWMSILAIVKIATSDADNEEAAPVMV